MIAIVDSGVANVASVRFALERLGVDFIVTADPETVERSSHVVLPGVGAAAPAMARLQEKGLAECLRHLLQPVLGICLGMQLLFENSEEGKSRLLNIIDASVIRFPTHKNLAVPHMGWNTVTQTDQHKLFMNIPDASYFYFVHSYFAPVGKYTLGQSCYGQSFSAVLAQDNFFGCQFHPERSGALGLQLLANFVSL